MYLSVGQREVDRGQSIPTEYHPKLIQSTVHAWLRDHQLDRPRALPPHTGKNYCKGHHMYTHTHTHTHIHTNASQSPTQAKSITR